MYVRRRPISFELQVLDNSFERVRESWEINSANMIVRNQLMHGIVETVVSAWLGQFIDSNEICSTSMENEFYPQKLTAWRLIILQYFRRTRKEGTYLSVGV